MFDPSTNPISPIPITQGSCRHNDRAILPDCHGSVQHQSTIGLSDSAPIPALSDSNIKQAESLRQTLPGTSRQSRDGPGRRGTLL